MRIIAGQYRGRALASVGKGDAAAHLRPTTDRVRESLFNILTGGRFGDPITGARVLDLFAGTGALGLEALSRGAAEAVFVDSGRKAGALISANLKTTGATGRLFRADATRLGRAEDCFDLVFLDPPYGTGAGEKALRKAWDVGWIANGALVVWEDNTAQAAPNGFLVLDARKFGQTHVTFLRAGLD
ncbi:MAG: 16S rRNA (guanine(966)-N(2))-methyltransferase RsmD [Pseudomonadota bacterium]